MKPLISIIVPVYKVEEYLNECVESIVNQTYNNIEIILVDDGSPDNCPRMCDEWVQKDNRIKVIHKENGGVSSARNAGLKAALGEWVWFVDSDDSAEIDALEKLIVYTENADLVVFNSKINDFYIKDECFFDDYYFKYLFGFEPWNKLYKLAIIKENNLQFDIEETIGEDLLFNITYYQFADKYRFTARKYYNYRIREDSAMHSGNAERLEQQLRLYSKIFDIYKDKQEERILAQLYIMHLISGINQCSKKSIDDEMIKLIADNRKQYHFNKKVFKTAVNAFLNCERASLLGKLRVKLFFYLFKINAKTAFLII